MTIDIEYSIDMDGCGVAGFMKHYHLVKDTLQSGRIKNLNHQIFFVAGNVIGNCIIYPAVQLYVSQIILIYIVTA